MTIGFWVGFGSVAAGSGIVSRTVYGYFSVVLPESLPKSFCQTRWVEFGL